MTVDEAIKTAKKGCNNPYAQAYLQAIPEAIELGGNLGGEAENSLKVQILYAVSNMAYWRGEPAKEVKKVLREFTKRK